MGVISASTFQMIKNVPVQRLTEKRKASDFAKKRGIAIVQYPGKSRNGLLKLTMQPIEQLRLTSCYPLKVKFTLLRHCSWFFGVSNCNCEEYHTRMQCSEKRSDFVLAYY